MNEPHAAHVRSKLVNLVRRRPVNRDSPFTVGRLAQVQEKTSFLPDYGFAEGGEAEAAGEATPAPRTLTESERATRVRALQGAMREEEAHWIAAARGNGHGASSCRVRVGR